jgi:chromosome segregation ATPase
MEQLRKGAHGAAVEAKVYLAPAKTLAKPSEFKVDDFVKSLSKTYSMEALLRKIESEIAELEERESTREQDMLLIKERIAVEQDEVKDIEKKIEKVQGNLEILNTLNERLDNLLPTLNPESDMFQIITTRSKSLARDNISPEELDETALELLEYIS